MQNADLSNANLTNANLENANLKVRAPIGGQKLQSRSRYRLKSIIVPVRPRSMSMSELGMIVLLLGNGKGRFSSFYGFSLRTRGDRCQVNKAIPNVRAYRGTCCETCSCLSRQIW
jgi:uncharacterized protein YjbI with pentapeptide repeats